MELIDLIIGLVLTIALIVCFSYFQHCPVEKPDGNGYGTQYKGDSDLILPGDGDSLANTSIESGSIPELVEKPTVAYKKSTTDSAIADKTEAVASSEVRSEETTKENKEEHNKVDGMIIAFWHGVAAVLIGEASALMVAFAWMKIRGGK